MQPTANKLPAPSKGHVCWFIDMHGRTREWFRTPNGEWYLAKADDAIDCRSGFRMGRWEGPSRWTLEDALRFFAVAPEHLIPDSKEN